MLHGSIPRPGVQLGCRAVELAQEVLVLRLLNPPQEVTCHAIALSPGVGLGTVFALEVLFEAAASQSHGIGHSLDEAPELSPIAIRTAVLGLQLIGMGELVIEHPTGFIVEPHGVTSGKTALYPACAVAYAHMVAASILLAHAVIVFQRVDDALELGQIGVAGTPVESLKHAPGILLDIRNRIGDDAMIDA